MANWPVTTLASRLGSAGSALGRRVAIIISSCARFPLYDERRNCSDLGVSAPYGRIIAPTSVYQRRGHPIGAFQERVARAKPLPGVGGVPHNKDSPFSWPGEGGQGDEVHHLVVLTWIGSEITP